jgi:hypothetical protein
MCCGRARPAQSTPFKEGSGKVQGSARGLACAEHAVPLLPEFEDLGVKEALEDLARLLRLGPVRAVSLRRLERVAVVGGYRVWLRRASYSTPSNSIPHLRRLEGGALQIDVLSRELAAQLRVLQVEVLCKQRVHIRKVVVTRWKGGSSSACNASPNRLPY